MASVKINEKTVPLLSVAVATAKTGISGQLIVDGAGKGAITGEILSPPMIVPVEIDVHPLTSVTV